MLLDPFLMAQNIKLCLKTKQNMGINDWVKKWFLEDRFNEKPFSNTLKKVFHLYCPFIYT